MSHTPEPWAEPDINHWASNKSNSKLDLGIVGFIDMCRAVACVNACAGMADPAAEITALRADKQVLVDALKAIQKYDNGQGCCDYGCDTPTIAREALAKVREKEEG